MTKTVCDICGKDMPPTIERTYITMRDGVAVDTEDYNFTISSYGKILDICRECECDLAGWIRNKIKERGEII